MNVATRVVQCGAPPTLRPPRTMRKPVVKRARAILEEAGTISFETLFGASFQQKNKNANDMNISFDEFYRVLLHYSQWQDDKPIAAKVRNAVPQLSMNECIRIVQMAQTYGSAIVTTLPKDEAELCCENLVNSGLKASIELA